MDLLSGRSVLLAVLSATLGTTAACSPFRANLRDYVDADIPADSATVGPQTPSDRPPDVRPDAGAETLDERPADDPISTTDGPTTDDRGCGSDGRCVECDSATDCRQLNAAGCFENRCGPCTRDTDCRDKGAGVCITDPDGRAGRCATVEETIFVKALPGFCPTVPTSGDGSPTNPFCRVSDALAATTDAKRVLLLEGPASLDSIFVDRPGSPLHIVGKGGVTIRAGGTNPGIWVTSAVDVRVRDLTIDRGGGVGVVAEGDATIRLNRCIITNNMRGGISVSHGAGFDVSNTVIANNGASLVGNVTFAAAFLGTATGGRPRRFRFNTVVNHPLGPAVVCEDLVTGVEGLLTFMNPGTDVVQCRVVNCSGSLEPLFSPTRPYHLTSNSPARNKVDRTLAPPDDVDGEPRDDAMADCGADEFHLAP